jgi:hypothetical protein
MFVSNYDFSEEYTELEADLRYALHAILSLSAATKVPKDKISFYMIAGRYLVPASVIVKNFTKVAGGKSRDGRDLRGFEITGPSPIFEFYDGQAPDKIVEQLWIREEDKYIEPTEANKNLMKTMLEKSVALRAHFTPSKLDVDLAPYALW